MLARPAPESGYGLYVVLFFPPLPLDISVRAQALALERTRIGNRLAAIGESNLCPRRPTACVHRIARITISAPLTDSLS